MSPTATNVNESARFASPCPQKRRLAARVFRGTDGYTCLTRSNARRIPNASLPASPEGLPPTGNSKSFLLGELDLFFGINYHACQTNA